MPNELSSTKMFVKRGFLSIWVEGISVDEIIAIVFLSQLAGFVIKGLAGFGNPLLTNPLMAMRLDNLVITPTNILLDLPVNAWISWRARHSFQIRQVLPVLIAILLGVIPGTLLLKLGTPWIIKALLGVFIIGLGVEMLLRNRSHGITPRSWLRNLLSFASGVMSGLFGINMLFLAYIERVSTDREAFRGSICFIFLIENAFRAVTYFANDIFTEFTLTLTAVSIPAAILGVWIGTMIDRRMGERASKRFIIFIFILGGLSILIKSILLRS